MGKVLLMKEILDFFWRSAFFDLVFTPLLDFNFTEWTSWIVGGFRDYW
jgi:hypothetical protein